MTTKRRRIGKTLLLVLAGLVILAFLLSSCAQDRFYYPVRGQSEHTPNDVGLSFEDVYFNSADGTRLHGWFIPAVGETRGLVLHVHGNAGRLEHHLGAILWLPRAHYAVLMFDYRGYGLSDDKKPAPKPLMEDTQAAIAYLKSRKDTALQKTLILAQSLGGNNAIAAVAQGNMKEVAGIVLDATFYSYKTIADDKLSSAGLLVSDQYSASRFIGQLAPIPLFFLHGDQDSVIPWQHTQKLFERAGAPKRIRIVPHAGHLRTLENPAVRAEVLDFFAQSLRENAWAMPSHAIRP
jgi:alpha-beta hydrolase superfamily lysophospholipase